MVDLASEIIGTTKPVTVISPMLMSIAGLFDKGARESVEMMYEFTRPFVVDSGHIERELGLMPTPVAEALERTVAWYRSRQA
jgi:nucleoside-diphosphate-sugar epimerase